MTTIYITPEGTKNFCTQPLPDYEIDEYEAVLQACKDSSVPFEDQFEIIILDTKCKPIKPNTFYQVEAEVEIAEQRRYFISETIGWSMWYNVEPTWVDGVSFETEIRKVARIKATPEEITKPVKEWTALQIAIYAVNCDNSKEKIEEVEKMILGRLKEGQTEIDTDAWNELGNEINKRWCLDDPFGVHPILDLIKQTGKFTITHKES